MKTPRPGISVIVPVYKAEKYLHRCVDSILAQTFTNFELILVDDGSPDGSGTLCDEYAQKDRRVKVLHKENGGVASARQCGIDNAKGEYTIHADPDDWVEPTMLEELYNKAIAENADMVICDFYVDTINDCIYRSQKVSDETSQKVLEDLLLHGLHGSLCNKLIKSACYTEFNIRFAENLNYCEDYLVCVKILMHNITIAYLDKAFYHYDQIVNNESITRKFTTKTIEQIKLFIINLEKIFNDRQEVINQHKLDLKILVFQENMQKEFKELYPEVNGQIWEMKTSFINRMLMYIATKISFKVSFWLYNLKVGINK